MKYIIFLISFLLCVNCGQQIAGGTTDTGNARIAAVVSLPNHSRASNALVVLRTQDYVSNATDVTLGHLVIKKQCFTNDTGYFAFDSLDSGSYSIEINDKKSHAGLLRVSLDNHTRQATSFQDTLHPYSTLKGIAFVPKQARSKSYVQVYGLERQIQIDSLGQFTIDSLPEGTYKLSIMTENLDQLPFTADSVKATSGIVSNLPYYGLQHSQKLFLNTSVTGASIDNAVTNFPILIRLTNSNFNFSEASAKGADLRFTTSHNVPLNYEIERFDSLFGAAEIWVNVDTVFGNDASQYIVMLWGTPVASNILSLSNGYSVFDTSYGFKATWHLDQQLSDATQNKCQGANYGTTDTIGIIGYCKKFNGKDSIKAINFSGNPHAISLSAWTRIDTQATIGSELVSFGDAVLIRGDDSWNGDGTGGSFCVNPNASIDSTHFFTKSGRFLKKTGWHFVVYTVDEASATQAMYIDGILVSSTNSPAAINYSGMSSATYFGTHAKGRTGFNFTGLLDEVRISSLAYSPEWIKLSYMNQRTDDRLVVFDKQ